MWSLYLLVNKLLNLEDDGLNRSENDGSLLVGSFQISGLPDLNHDAPLHRSHFVEVPHVNQLYDWDCGLACILMVFQTIGIKGYDLPTLGRLCGTRSIWTVDLAYLLQKFSIPFSYFTVTLGANPDFSVETFYKDELPNDLVRVDLLFQKALEAGIKIECRSISRKEMSLLILSGRYIAIALVDQYKLSYGRKVLVSLVCATTIRAIQNNNPSKVSNPKYKARLGHYVIICGYDAESDEFEIRDPASSRKRLRVPVKRFDEAHKSFGTDEDLLLVDISG